MGNTVRRGQAVHRRPLCHPDRS